MTRRANWPSSAEERQRVRKRTLERRELGLPTPSGIAARYATEKTESPLTPQQMDAVHAVAKEVARTLGVSVDDLSQPDAIVQMLASNSLWREESTRGGLRVELAIHDSTCPPQFEEDTTQPPLAACEAVIYASGQRCAVARAIGDVRLPSTCVLLGAPLVQE